MATKVKLIETGAVTGNIIPDGGIATGKLANDAVTTIKISDANITHAKLHTSMDLTGKTVTVATAAGSTNTTAAASTAFVQQELTTLIGGAPGTLDTLNELAAAINDDASYASTLTTALATKLPLAGGTMTGPVVLNELTVNPTNNLVIFNEASTNTDLQTVVRVGTAGGGLYLTSDNAGVSKGAYYDGGWIATSTSGNSTDYGAGTSGDINVKMFSGATIGSFVPSWDTSIVMKSTGIYVPGNVTIGTPSVSSSYGRLTVAGTGISITPDTSAKMQIGRYNAANPYSYIKAGSTSSGFKFTNAADSLDIFTIENGGNVGIGTSSPSQKLHIYESSTGSQAYVTVQNNRSRNAAVLTQTTNGGFYTGTSIGTDTFCWQVYDASAGERMRIDASGNIMIGPSTDVNPWNDTSGNGGIVMRQDGVLSSARLNAEPLLLNRIGTDGELVKLNKAGATIGHIGAFAGYAYFGNATTNSNGIIFTHAAIEPFNSATAASDKDTDIDLGASNQRFKNLYLSGASYIPDVRSTGIQYFTNTTGVRFRNTTGTEHMRLGAGASTGNMALGLIGVSGANSEAAIHGQSNDSTLLLTNTDLSSNSTWGFTGRGGRILTSNGSTWTNDGKDAALIIGSNKATTQRGGGLGIVLHNESNVNGNYSPGIYFSTQSESGGYNTAYGYIMGAKTGRGGDTNWSTGEIHMDTAGSRSGSNARTEYMDGDPAFRIDGAGDISMPYTSHAYGQFAGSSVTNPTNNAGWAMSVQRSQNMTYQNNASHGHGMTVTKAGMYVLGATGLYDPVSYAYIGWCINGSMQHHWHSNHTIESNHDYVSVIMRYLNIGDHVTFESSTIAITEYWGSSHSSWYMYKVG